MPATIVLPRYIVGIDVETTSLDPAAGEIIDVAAIRYDLQSGLEVGRFSALAKPSRPVTAETTALTGITNEMVATAPPFADLLVGLQQFIGTDTLFAHNARFDIEWLTYHGLAVEKNPVWDTFMLATITWPESESYNLGTLAASLELPIVEEHRAAADVVLTWHLFQRIRDQLTLPAGDLELAIKVFIRAGIEHYIPLLRERQADHVSLNTESEQIKKPSAPEGLLQLTPRVVLGERGILTSRLAGFSSRSGQVHMAEVIDDWIGQGAVGLIEAGTGTGKTYAYLVACLAGLAQSKRVFISTYTRHLQDQLLQQDIPRLFENLAVLVSVAGLKGRRNYLCHSRLQQVLNRSTFMPIEAFLLVKILHWLSQGGSGDIEQINTSYQADGLLRHLHADALSCRQSCKNGLECPYYRAKRRADQAQIVVINHALLAQMVLDGQDSSGNVVVIVDEAHHLEEAVREASKLDLSHDRLAEALAPIIALSAQHKDTQAKDHVSQACNALLQEYDAWLGEVGQAVLQHTMKGRLLITPTVRRGSHWQKAVQHASLWRGRLKFILGLAKSIEPTIPQQQQLLLHEAIGGIERLAIEFENFIEGSSERIQWVELRSEFKNPTQFTVLLHDVALAIAPPLQSFWSTIHSGVLTSATMTIHGKFDYMQRLLGLEAAPTVITPNLFDYKSNMLLYLVDDSPSPSDPGFDNYVAGVIEDLTMTTRGRLLGLFSSQKGVQAIYRMLIRPLNKAKIKLYAQKLTGGRHNILKRFHKLHRSVLLGTVSFWEGVDVPGESLSVVVIVKLPFPAPDDPVLNAVAAHQGVHLFADIFVPHMILRLRQGVGRLLRSQTDRGVVVLLDSRFHHHNYGGEVLGSLPPATIHIGSHREVTAHAREWIGTEVIARWREEA